MNEKQRILARDLEAWRKKEMDRIGYYHPNKPAPPHIRAARAARRRAGKIVDRWESKQRAMHGKKKEAIAEVCDNVRRIIVFEDTEKALKALKQLGAKPVRA